MLDDELTPPPSSGAPAGGRGGTLAAGASPLPLPSPPPAAARGCARAKPGRRRRRRGLSPPCAARAGAGRRGRTRALRSAGRGGVAAALRVARGSPAGVVGCDEAGRARGLDAAPRPDLALWQRGPRAATSAGSSLPGGGGRWWCVLVVGDGGCDFGGGSARSDFSAVRASEGLGCGQPPRPGPCRLVGVAAQ